MSHKTAKSAYKNLEERLNQSPQGAPPSQTLYKILSILFSEKEAEIENVNKVSCFPPK